MIAKFIDMITPVTCRTAPAWRGQRVVAVVAAALLLGCLALPANATSSQRFDCVKDWSAASEIVAREKLAAVSSLSDAARTAGKNDIVKSTLCRVGGQFVYRVVMRDRSGRLKTETVDARAPFGVPQKAR